MSHTLKTLLIGILLSTSSIHAAECVSKDEAMANLVTYFTAQDVVHLDFDIEGVDPQTFPVFFSLCHKVVAENDFPDVSTIRIYGSEAKIVKKKLFTEFSANFKFYPNYNGGSAYAYNFHKEMRSQIMKVDCSGRVDTYSHYDGPE